MFVGVSNDSAYAWKRSHLLGGTLRIAPGHYDASLRIFPVDTADCGARVLVGGRSDRTSVQNDDFGLCDRRRPFEAALFKLTLDGRTIRLRRPAAKILYVKTCHHTIVAALPGPDDGSHESRRCAGAILRGFRQPFRGLHLFARKLCGACCWWMTISRCC